MLLFFVRHGDPTYDPDALTPLGFRQAEAVGKRLALYGLDEIYASSAIRAIQTATPAAEMTKKEIQVLDWANEHYAWLDLSIPDPDTGMPNWGFLNPEVIDLFLSPEMTALGQDWISHPFFSGTRFGSGYTRIKTEAFSFLESQGFAFDESRGMYRVLQPANDRRVAFFAHQGFGLAFLSAVLGVPYPRFCTSFDFSYTGLTVLEFRTGREYTPAKMLTLGNDGHLYREGLSTRYQNEIPF